MLPRYLATLDLINMYAFFPPLSCTHIIELFVMYLTYCSQ